MKIVYALYDGTYPEDEDAMVYMVADTLEEARKAKSEWFNDSVIVVEKLQKQTDGSMLVVSSELLPTAN